MVSQTNSNTNRGKRRDRRGRNVIATRQGAGTYKEVTRASQRKTQGCRTRTRYKRAHTL